MILGQMQNPAIFPADHFSDLLGRLPADIDLDALARQTKAIDKGAPVAGEIRMRGIST
jgi:hypothetical protein